MSRENDDTAILIIARDITNQEQVKTAENYYRTIFENTGAATMIFDEDMTVIMVNEESQRLLGYEKGELIGIKWADLINADMVATVKEYNRMRRIDPSVVPHKYNTHLLNKQGKYRDGQIAVDIIPGTNKSVATFIDFTEFNLLTVRSKPSAKLWQLSSTRKMKKIEGIL